MPRFGIREVMDLAWATKNAIRLEAGEPDFGTPCHIVEGAIRALRAGHTKYIPNAGLGDLRGPAPQFLGAPALRQIKLSDQISDVARAAERYQKRARFAS